MRLFRQDNENGKDQRQKKQVDSRYNLLSKSVDAYWLNVMRKIVNGVFVAEGIIRRYLTTSTYKSCE